MHVPSGRSADGSREHSRARGSAVRKLGLAAFLFFFAKGLLWLLVPAAVYFWGC